jgi:hypothetical protein
MTSQYGAYALRAGLARLYARMRMQTPTLPGTHMQPRTRKHANTEQYVYLLLFHSNNGFVNAPQRYVICTLSVLYFKLVLRISSESKYIFSVSCLHVCNYAKMFSNIRCYKQQRECRWKDAFWRLNSVSRWRENLRLGAVLFTRRGANSSSSTKTGSIKKYEGWNPSCYTHCIWCEVAVLTEMLPRPLILPLLDASDFT